MELQKEDERMVNMGSDMKVEAKLFRMDLGDGVKVPLPEFATPGSAAMDFYSANQEPVKIFPGETAAVPLGIKVALPWYCKLTIKPRSGLALKNGITIVNSPGTVDSDYRGEVKVILHNLSDSPFVVEPFSRVCQGEIERVTKIPFEEVPTEEYLGDTLRGAGGFNSTGTGKL